MTLYPDLPVMITMKTAQDLQREVVASTRVLTEIKAPQTVIDHAQHLNDVLIAAMIRATKAARENLTPHDVHYADHDPHAS